MGLYNLVSIGLTALMLSGVALVNITVDPGAIYLRKYLTNSEFDLYAKTLVRTRFGLLAEGWNERSTKIALARIASRSACAVLGSSRVMSVSIYHQPNLAANYCGSLVNLGVSGAGIEDMVIFLYMMASEHQVPRRVFLGIDPWTFQFVADPRFRENEAVYRRALEAFNGHAPELQESHYGKLAANLVNADYFRGSLEMLDEKGGRALVREYAQAVARNNTVRAEKLAPLIVPPFESSRGYSSAVTLPDGSLSYSQATLAAFMEQRFNPLGVPYKITAGMSYDGAAPLLRAVVENLQGLGTEVFFVLVPYRPDVWSDGSPHQVRAMTEVSRTVHRLAVETGVRVIGSYNPANMGCARDEFFDQNHPRPSCLNKLFGSRRH